MYSERKGIFNSSLFKIPKMFKPILLFMIVSIISSSKCEDGPRGERGPPQNRSPRGPREGPPGPPSNSSSAKPPKGPPGSPEYDNTTTLVHLFEWKYADIADECERFLGPNGYGGVQISPPSENALVFSPFRPWWERYQVVSYELETRSGNEDDLRQMTRRCNKVGVRIFADIVVNHMTGTLPNDTGTAGSKYNANDYDYPTVPYTYDNFHAPCELNDFNNATELRVCQLVGLKDLNQTEPYVRDKIIDFLNHLIDVGLAGFRVDAAKHMYPSDLEVIYSSINDLSTEAGFPPNTRPYIYQEVINFGGDVVPNSDYTVLGAVTEFKFGTYLYKSFTGKDELKNFRNWGPEWGLMPSNDALVFVDNHDNQRGHSGENSGILTHRDPKTYKPAVAFMLAHPYGRPRVMSSFYFETTDQGPPANDDGDLISPAINENGTCGNGWVCEHRWHEIYEMVKFREVVKGTEVTEWWDNNGNQIAFSRGDKGFIAFNLDQQDLNETIKTNLREGKYCDVISGQRINDACSGLEVTVDADGNAQITIAYDANDPFLAIHVGPESRLSPR